jgi:hypothetical protein
MYMFMYMYMYTYKYMYYVLCTMSYVLCIMCMCMCVYVYVYVYIWVVRTIWMSGILVHSLKWDQQQVLQNRWSGCSCFNTCHVKDNISTYVQKLNMTGTSLHFTSFIYFPTGFLFWLCTSACLFPPRPLTRNLSTHNLLTHNLLTHKYLTLNELSLNYNTDNELSIKYMSLKEVW